MEDFYGLEGLEKLSEQNPSLETFAYVSQDDEFVRVSDLDEVYESIEFGRVYFDSTIEIDGKEYVRSADFDDLVADVRDSLEEDEDHTGSKELKDEQAFDIVDQYAWKEIIVVNVTFLSE